MSSLETLLRELNIIPVKLLGRVKTQQSMELKLEKITKIAPDNTTYPDTIGMRVIVQTDKELDTLYHHLLKTQHILFVKDYVNNPRKDGLILNTDPGDIYQSYHVFTDTLNGVPTEIQLRTIAMEENRLRLAQKYGDEYWKTDEFRKNKYLLGDKR